MARAILIIIGLFLIVSCEQNQAPLSVTTSNSALGTDSSKTIEPNKKPTSISTDTALVSKGNVKLEPAFIGSIKLFSPITKDLDDEDDEDDDDEEDEKEGRTITHLYEKHP